jgi:hypothetical protein
VHDLAALFFLLVSLAALGVAAWSAWRAGPRAVFDAARFLDLRQAPEPARPHLRRALWAVAVCALAEAGDMGFRAAFPRPPLEWGVRPG